MAIMISRRRLVSAIGGAVIASAGAAALRVAGVGSQGQAYASEVDVIEPDDVILQDISMDGYWGAGTTAALQAYLKVTVTATIEHQYAPNIQANPGLTSGWYCDNTLLGDPTIRVLQARLGTSVDGIFGTNDICALQSRMGTTVDGVLSAPSTCIKTM